MENGDLFGGQIIVGVVTSLINIAVHAVIMAMVSWAAGGIANVAQAVNVQVRLVVVMMAVVTVLMVAHLAEICIWGLAYVATGVAPGHGDAVYFAFVNYTTLGYGDILPAKHWRMLGPMTAMNGVLLFGWSTAVIYDILRNTARIFPMKPN